jgi:hypothetical protein
MIPGQIKNKYGFDMQVSALAIDRSQTGHAVSPIGTAYGRIPNPYLFRGAHSASETPRTEAIEIGASAISERKQP